MIITKLRRVDSFAKFWYFCVGCRICASVCPRGVLKLENDNPKGRINSKDVLLGKDVDLMDLVNQNK